MRATKRIASLDEGGIFARIDKHVLVDLDQALFEMVEHRRDDDGWDYDWEEDCPTRISLRPQEAEVRHLRISPCYCGDHGSHIDTAHEDENGMPDRADGRGAFLGVMFG